MRRQRAAHVAVKRAIADGHLRFVAGRQHQRAELVRQRHQRHAAQPRLDVFLGLVRLGSGKNFCQLFFNRLKTGSIGKTS